MKAAKSVDDPEKIMASMQKGLDNLPKEKEIFDFPTIDENGGLVADLQIGAVENGKIVKVK
jgi:branched-chain amino acid transport system substrate-binding protein